MEVNLCLGGLMFRILVDREVPMETELMPYFVDTLREPDITVSFRWQWDVSCAPEGICLGRDLILEYYKGHNKYIAMAIAGCGTFQARTDYTPDGKYMECRLNEEKCRPERINMMTLLRFLPLRAVFDHFGILFFHAAQVAVGGRGVLFTAASGTGKTTQAKLWRDLRGAELLCNDRTLLRRLNGQWHTYGYPLDGSEPVRSTAVTPLGAVVLLEQGPENHAERLTGGKAVAALLSQLVLDAWDPDARLHAIDLLADLLTEIPVYRLTCTPDERAVRCLEGVLREEKTDCRASERTGSQ